MKLEAIKSRNGDMFVAKTHDRHENTTFDSGKQIKTERSIENIRTLDLIKEVKMPIIKNDLKADQRNYEKDERPFYGNIR
jgi:hypothetical protein